MFIQKRRNGNKTMFLCFCVFLFMFVFQKIDPFSGVNMIMPGSLLPFKKEIVDIFRKEKQILFRKQRYAKVFRDISIAPIFSNRRSIKNLLVKSKIA